MKNEAETISIRSMVRKAVAESVAEMNLSTEEAEKLIHRISQRVAHNLLELAQGESKAPIDPQLILAAVIDSYLEVD